MRCRPSVRICFESGSLWYTRGCSEKKSMKFERDHKIQMGKDGGSFGRGDGRVHTTGSRSGHFRKLRRGQQVQVSVYVHIREANGLRIDSAIPRNASVSLTCKNIVVSKYLSRTSRSTYRVARIGERALGSVVGPAFVSHHRGRSSRVDLLANLDHTTERRCPRVISKRNRVKSEWFSTHVLVVLVRKDLWPSTRELMHDGRA